MSATAGKVMPRPMGDYNSATEYTVLDIVIYNGRPYMAKQTTQGNLPTNTTYWLLLLDFPTEVDNVPTENSQNLVRSGGVYSATNDKMKTDGSNAESVTFAPSTKESYLSATITKNAGDNQDVSAVFTVTDSDTIYARNIAGILRGHIGDVMYYSNSGEYIGITLASVTIAVDDSTVTAVGKLVDDVSDAISVSKYVYFNAYNNGGAGTIVIGSGAAVQSSGIAIGQLAASCNDGAVAIGAECAAVLSNTFAEGKNTTAWTGNSHAEGLNTFAWGNGSHAEGNHTWASGNYSHAGGTDSQSGGANSFAHGDHVTSRNNCEAAFGKYNSGYQVSGKQSLLSVGNGQSGALSDAFTVYEDGYISVGSGHNRFKFTKNNGIWGFYDDDNVFHNVGKIRLSQSVTLSTSTDTTVTFSNAAITNDSVIEPLTSVWGLIPTTITTTTGSSVLTFAKAASADTVTVAIDIS